MKNIINKISHLSSRTRQYSGGIDAGSSSLFLLLLFIFSSSFTLAFYAPTSGPTSLNGAFTLDSTLSSLNFSSGSSNGSLSIQKTGSVTNRLSYTSNSGSLGTQTDNQALNIKNSSGTSLTTALKNGATTNLFTVIGDLIFTQDIYQNATKLEFPWDRDTSDYTTASNITSLNGVTDKVSIAGTNPANNFIFEIKNPLAQALDTKALSFKSTSNPLIHATPSRIWGEGRDSPANMLVNQYGERAGSCGAAGTSGTPCVNSGLKISKSKRLTHCDNMAAACPIGWWACRMTNEKAANEIQSSTLTSASMTNKYGIYYGTPAAASDYYKNFIGGAATTSSIYNSYSNADDYICNKMTGDTLSTLSALAYGAIPTVYCCARTSNF